LIITATVEFSIICDNAGKQSRLELNEQPSYHFSERNITPKLRQLEAAAFPPELIVLPAIFFLVNSRCSHRCCVVRWKIEEFSFLEDLCFMKNKQIKMYTHTHTHTQGQLSRYSFE